MTSSIQIAPDALEAIKSFKLPRELGFGVVLAPVMINCDYENGHWGQCELLPYGPISLEPTAKVFHYAQEIFEGLKAYNYEGKGPLLFRPELNAERFDSSAERMAMPVLPPQLFMESVQCLTSYCTQFISKRSGESLYLRPFMFATQESLGIRNSTKFKFMVVASPSGSYFSDGSLAVLIERNDVRAVSGGVGTAKTGGNYAASIFSSVKAREMGFMQTLWLDAKERRFLEEMSGMNFMCIINGELWTPKRTDTILDGITRRSILEIASELELKVREETMEIDELIKKIQNQECTEAFACGTAAIVTPIEFLGEKDGQKYFFRDPKGDISIKIKERLLAIQEGRIKGPPGWQVPIEPAIL